MAKRKKEKKKVASVAPREEPLRRQRIFVDYENCPDALHLLEQHHPEEVWIFVGRQQKKIPLEAVQQVQKLGSHVHWVAPGAVGKNALDFIMALYIGKQHATTEKALPFAVMTADRGFDPLVRELEREGRPAVRIDPTKETPLERPRRRVPPATLTHLVELTEERLRRMPADRLPGRRRSLIKLVESQLPASHKDKAEAVVESLKKRRFVAIQERSGAVKYPGRQQGRA